MKTAYLRTLAIALGITTTTAPSWQAMADNGLVKFPENYADGVHYVTVQRRNITEELFTSRTAIEAAKRGEPLPSGTVVTLVDYRGGAIHRYVVMEKRDGWGELSPPDIRNGDWLYREFAPDGSPNLAEGGSRCMACHRSQAEHDFVFTLDRMRATQ
jgi:hypothetical protein